MFFGDKLLGRLRIAKPESYFFVTRMIPLSIALFLLTLFMAFSKVGSATSYSGDLIAIVFCFYVVFTSFKVAGMVLNSDKSSIFLNFWFVAYAVLLYLDIFSFQYKDCGLYSTHCAPNDFVCQTTPIHDGLISLYFSIITLTTIGFGDFIPATPLCRFFVCIEAMSGYFFLALLIALMTKLIAARR